MQLLQDCEGFVADREQALAGLRRYENEATALEIEQSNDAVHFLYIDNITEAANTFLNGFPGTCLYAAKANPHPALLRLLWAAGVRHFEVASIREVENLRAEFPLAQLYFMHPSKAVRRLPVLMHLVSAILLSTVLMNFAKSSRKQDMRTTFA